MLISDLKSTCENCQGSGFKAGIEEWGGIQTNFSKFCMDCSGRGFNLTELGKNLWDLYLPMLKELIKEEFNKK
tara:strand:- start:201 stop:419 length:219 start_codon:yes stop_codon:yes gene_type:complete